jgi:hypothetical protein
MQWDLLVRGIPRFETVGLSRLIWLGMTRGRGSEEWRTDSTGFNAARGPSLRGCSAFVAGLARDDSWRGCAEWWSATWGFRVVRGPSLLECSASVAGWLGMTGRGFDGQVVL